MLYRSVVEEAPASLVGGYGSDDEEEEEEEAAPSGIPAGFFDSGDEPAAKRTKTGTTSSYYGNVYLYLYRILLILMSFVLILQKRIQHYLLGFSMQVTFFMTIF